MSTIGQTGSVVKGRASAQLSRRRVTDEFNRLVGDVRPFKLVSFQPQDYVLRYGLPYVPKYWAQAVTAVSATGEFFAVERPSPREIEVRCHTRFLAGTDLWDDPAGVWRPFYSEGIDYFWVADPLYKPQPQTLDFRIRKEILDLDVLTFSPGDFLDSSFNTGIDDALAYTMIVVVSTEAPTDYTIARSEHEGIWAGESYKVFSDANSVSVSSLRPPTQISPSVLIMSVSPPTATLWVSTPDRKLYKNTVTNHAMGTTQMVFSLGKSLNDAAEAYMHVLEFTLLDYPVRTTEANRERYNLYQLAALYSSMYGTDL